MRTRTIISIIGILAVVFFAIPTTRHWAARVYGDLVLDSSDHGKPCDELPSPEKVVAALKDHRALVDRIIAVDPSFVSVSVGDGGRGCSETGDIEIRYGTHSQRERIEEILKQEHFGNVPYRLINM